MRRDYVTLDVRHTDPDDETLPTVALTVDERTDLLDGRFDTVDGDRLDGDGIDAAYRLKTSVDGDDDSGVFSLSNRVTGEFLLEVNAAAPAVLDLVDVARQRETDGEGCYRVVVRQAGEDVASFEKRMLLVYDDEGSLLRQHSLIPSGVEL